MNKVKHIVDEFGIKIALVKIIARVLGKIPILKRYIYKLKDISIEKYLFEEFNETIRKFNEKKSEKVEDNVSKDIWIMWWQGESNAPELVRHNIDQIKSIYEDGKVHIITKENVSSYINIPSYIYDKVDSKNITITYLSDIIRMKILGVYGGLWIDSTIFILNPIKVNDLDFFTLKGEKPARSRDFYYENISHNRWSVYFMYGVKDYPLFSFAGELLMDYWHKHDYIIDYFLTDYVIDMANKNIVKFDEDLNKIKISNTKKEFLNEIMNDEFSEKEYSSIRKSTDVFKLSNKKTYYLKTGNNKKTYFYYYINNLLK